MLSSTEVVGSQERPATVVATHAIGESLRACNFGTAQADVLSLRLDEVAGVSAEQIRCWKSPGAGRLANGWPGSLELNIGDQLLQHPEFCRTKRKYADVMNDVNLRILRLKADAGREVEISDAKSALSSMRLRQNIS